jgi:uncharacterized repeat protein (TIGR03803 family)
MRFNVDPPKRGVVPMTVAYQKGMLWAALALLPLQHASGAPLLKVILNFNGANGSEPLAGLIADRSGNLYGTTNSGGASGNGTVFRLTPPAAGKTAWVHSILASFTGPNGSGPQGGLIIDNTGNLYGTTYSGGGLGNAFKLVPPVTGKGGWTVNVLTSLNGADGFYPTGTLLADSSGNLFGTASFGGPTTTCAPLGCGTVFELTPPPAGQTAWTDTVLTSFTGTNGAAPEGGLIADNAGNLYGTTGQGGSASSGTVFKLAPPAAGKTKWRHTVLASLKGLNSSIPSGGLTRLIHRHSWDSVVGVA